MFKKRIVAVVAGLVLLLAVASVDSIIAASLGLSPISPAYACSGSSCHCSGGSGGGGC